MRRRGARRIASIAAVGAALAILAGVGCSALVNFGDLEGAPREAGASDGAPREGAAADGSADGGANADALATNDADSKGDAANVDASDGAASSSYRAVVLSDGPIMYLRLNDAPGSATAKDETGNYMPKISGTVTFGTAGALAKDPDRAMTFDGMTSTIDVGTALDFKGTDPYTLEAWVNPSVSDGEYRFVFSKNFYDDAGARQEFGLVHQTGAIAFERYVDDVGAYASGGIQTSTWQHLAAVYDGASSFLYVNGTQVASKGDSRAQPAKATHFTVGVQDEFQDGVFAGALDEIAVYAKALSATQLQKHYLVGTGQ